MPEGPKISIRSGNPTSEEAAAIAAAIARVRASGSVASAGEGSGESGWALAALREGVEARRLVADVWGTAPPRPGELPTSPPRRIG